MLLVIPESPNSCRKNLRPSQAEAAFDIDYFQPIAMEKAGFREENTPLRTETDDTVDTSQDNSHFHKFVKRYEALSIKTQRQLLEHMLKKLVVDTGGVDFYQFVSEYFFKSSLAAMKTFFDAKKANLILKLLFLLLFGTGVT